MSNQIQELQEDINDLALLLVISSDEDSLREHAQEIIQKILLRVDGAGTQSQVMSEIGLLIRSFSQSTLLSDLKSLVSKAQILLSSECVSEVVEKKENSECVEQSEMLAVEKSEDETPRMNSFLESFYENHKSFILDIKNKFLEIQHSNFSSPVVSNDVHQDFESYVLRLNQDATKAGIQALSDIAQKLFTLLMQYPLVDISEEFEVVSKYVLGELDLARKGGQTEDNLPAEIVQVLEKIERKLSLQDSESANRSAVEIPESNSVTLGTYLIDADSDILSEFIAEARDHLSAVEAILLERDLDFSSDDVDTLFRGVHSLKGTSSYFNLLEINESSHLLENILDEVRKGDRVLDQDLKSLVLRYVDIESKLLESAQKAVAKDNIMVRSVAVKELISDIEDFFNGTFKKSCIIVTEQDRVVESEVLSKDALPIPELPELDSSPSNLKELPLDNQKKQTQKEPSITKSFVKVDTERLDYLGEMIGEMVIYSSMLVKKCRDLLVHDEVTMRMSDQVEKFSRELQDIGMSMRLDPIRGLFQKLSRLVWDTSRKLGKDIKFEVFGEDTELDRNVIERLADPLMHMVRNSLDHGIEDPETRVQMGKSPTGRISLSSSHEGGSIVIKIQDDGRGLDPAKILNKAIEKGIVPKDVNLSEPEIFQLIFAPGFSTAEKVTDISGRGVGMDVVRTNIESMRGRIQIHSVLGQGTIFSIELPLTLAIIEGIEASVGSSKFIFPMLSVVELTKSEESMLGTSLHAHETYYFRGQHIPLFRLSHIFNLNCASQESKDGRIIVLNNGVELVAILVDEIGGNCQTVIKNLGPLFEKQSGIAGCAIVNNGDIGLIIDVRSLVQTARMAASYKNTLRETVSRFAELPH